MNITVTAIIKNEEDKYLLTKRSPNKKRWPNLWTVPGGHVEPGLDWDLNTSADYNILEKSLQREVREEVGLEIDNIKYICSVAYSDTICVSFSAGKVSKDVFLNEEESTEYGWFSLEEIKTLNTIPNIISEFEMLQ